jgi:hypothetical protein
MTLIACFSHDSQNPSISLKCSKYLMEHGSFNLGKTCLLWISMLTCIFLLICIHIIFIFAYVIHIFKEFIKNLSKIHHFHLRHIHQLMSCASYIISLLQWWKLIYFIHREYDHNQTFFGQLLPSNWGYFHHGLWCVQ